MKKLHLGVLALAVFGLLSLSLVFNGNKVFAVGEVAVDNSNLVWSPYGWVSNGSTYRQSPTVGSYVNIAFTGTTLGLNVDTSMIVAPASANNIRVVAYIDGNSTPIVKTLNDVVTNQLTFSAGLSSGSHYAKIVLSSNNNMSSRWSYSGPPISLLRITSLQLSASGTILDLNSTPINQTGPKIIYYGDSITEGNGLSGSYGDTSNAAIVGQQLSGKYGIHGYSSLTWWLSVVSNTPDFYLPTSNIAQFPDAVWNNYYQTESLFNTSGVSSSGYKDGTPDAVFNNLGINDVSIYGLGPPFGGTNAVNLFKANIAEWLNQERSALGARPAIFMVMPFNYNCTTTSNPSYNAGNISKLQIYRQAWLDTIDEYKTSSTDNRVFVIDLGEAACETVVANSSDNLHPNPTGSQILGTQIADLARPNIIMDTPFTAKANGQTLADGIELTSPLVLTGTSPAFSTVTITSQPGNSVCITTANLSGNWTCSMEPYSTTGDYTLTASAYTTYGQLFNLGSYDVSISAELLSATINDTSILAPTGTNYLFYKFYAIEFTLLFIFVVSIKFKKTKVCFRKFKN